MAQEHRGTPCGKVSEDEAGGHEAVRRLEGQSAGGSDESLERKSELKTHHGHLLACGAGRCGSRQAGRQDRHGEGDRARPAE